MSEHVPLPILHLQHTHTHTHSHAHLSNPPPFYRIALGRMINLLLLISLPEPSERPKAGHSLCACMREVEEQSDFRMTDELKTDSV